ncbi:hypothetical protein Ahy_B07g087715 [Arachis hypogaea]|uniref:Pentatricopeptide repeat-containing protein n=1 Tax=Arachis hypogaea TaxID=3818 RepID=A0A444YCS6_ARAHY|nr:hypothetical protein Ahy_B07g087715 [Arachis hypogaea]
MNWFTRSWTSKNEDMELELETATCDGDKMTSDGLELVAGRISILNVVLRVGSRYSRYALFQIPNSVFHSALRLCFPSISSLHSHFQPQSLDEAVDSFTRMLFMRRPPSIIQFTKILGSLVKTNHCPTAISLLQQLQSRVITPNLFTLNILINCCRGMVWITLAVSAFAKIFKSDFQPYIVTLTTIIKGLCLCGNAKKALHFHDKVLAHGFHY